jgi:2-dehydro-3-deoxygalactonokinase
MLAFPATGRARLHIVPGVIQRGAVPDVMRGEETQIVGALERVPGLGAGARLALPGSHCKWVTVESSVIRSFTTYLTGELFAVLREHSILGRPAREASQHAAAGGPVPGVASWESFDRGVIAARDSAPAGATALLFSTRTLVLTGQLTPRAASTISPGC